MPINANDYIVSSVRYDGTGSREDNIALKRISALPEATNEQINSSYIVLADQENHKNYKANLGRIINNLREHAEGYTDVKIEWLKNTLESQLHIIRDNLVTLQTKVEGIPTLQQIQALISNDIADITNLLDAKADKESVNSLRTSLANVQAVINSLKPIATSGNYNDLTNTPTLFSGDYNDLANKPSLFSGDYNDLTNKPNISEEINTVVNDLQSSVNKILDELTIKSESEENNYDSRLNSFNTIIDNLLDRIEYLELYGGGGTPTDPTGPTGPTGPIGPTGPEPPKITYKFWLISSNELETYFNGETFIESFNNKFVASKVNGCPFTNEGYSALYLIKQKFGYDSSINKIDGLLYLVIPTKYGKIREEDGTININGKSLASNVFEIYGNEYYKQNITIEDITYNIIKVSNETSIGDGIKLKLI